MANAVMGSDEYKRWLNEFDGCPLCKWQENQIILKETKYWVWIYSKRAYRQYNTLFIPKRHIENIGEVKLKEWANLVWLYRYSLWRMRELYVSDEFIYMWRKRDKYTDSSGIKKVDHLHILFMPDNRGWFDPILDTKADNITAIENLKKIIKINSRREEKQSFWDKLIWLFR